VSVLSREKQPLFKKGWWAYFWGWAYFREITVCDWFKDIHRITCQL